MQVINKKEKSKHSTKMLAKYQKNMRKQFSAFSIIDNESASDKGILCSRLVINYLTGRDNSPCANTKKFIKMKKMTRIIQSTIKYAFLPILIFKILKKHK
jgi:hypothetical protein